jgi:hypothetical protein
MKGGRTCALFAEERFSHTKFSAPNCRFWYFSFDAIIEGNFDLPKKTSIDKKEEHDALRYADLSK